MFEASNWDDYFVRVGRYLESRDIESEELNYKHETAQELARYRDELLSQQAPISIKPSSNLKNLGGFLKFPDVLKWLSTEAGADALRELWARNDDDQPASVPPVDEVIERVRRFSRRLPNEILQGHGTRMRPISVLLMALDAEQYPVFMTTVFKSAYTSTGFKEPSKGYRRGWPLCTCSHIPRSVHQRSQEATSRQAGQPPGGAVLGLGA